MKALNYCTKLAEFLRAKDLFTTLQVHTNLGYTNDLKRLLLTALGSAEKFILPTGGRVLADDEIVLFNSDEIWSDYARTPYPITALEYTQIENAPRHIEFKNIILTIEINELKKLDETFFNTVKKGLNINGDWDINNDAHVMFSFCSSESGSRTVIPPNMWLPTAEYAYLKYGSAKYASSLIFKQPKGAPSQETEISKLLGNAVAITGNFLFALTLKNINIETLPAPKFLNKKRIKKGKAPFYSYHVLTDFIEMEQTTRQQSYKTNGHASPRFHKRRGHVRRLQNGVNVWVNSCTVGALSRGMVDKDYATKVRRENGTTENSINS